jgi:uncharacterized damage-inducible protein DinB
MSAAMIEDLLRHKWHANAAYLSAVCENEAARQDEEVRKLLHHILTANRFWLFLVLGREFDRERETRVPDGLNSLAASYRETMALELEWVSRCNDAELHRQLVTPRFPGQIFTVEQVLMQVCLHSHGHRAQLAGKLRSLGGTPPATDFVLWIRERPEPEWPSSAN